MPDPRDPTAMMSAATCICIEALLNESYTAQEIVAFFELGAGGARWVQGFAGYHEGIGHGIGGTSWTRGQVKIWNHGWKTAAKRDGNRKVTRADCGEDFDSCVCCCETINKWHSPACVVFRDDA